MKEKEITYTEAMSEIEEILTRFNTAQMSVDELGCQVKRATDLIKLCKSRLRQAEIEVGEALDVKGE